MSETTAAEAKVQDDIAKVKQSNDDRRADKLMKQAQRAHDWRVQVWAQSELRLKRVNAELEAMGRDAFQPYEPDFTDPERLAHYSEMSLPK